MGVYSYLNQLFRQVGDTFDPRFDPRVKEQERLQQLTVGVDPRQMDRPQISIADLEGMPFVTSMSDRTAAGGMLTNIKGRDLNTPVNLRGGQDYMFDNNPGQVWASAKVPSNQMLTAAQELKRDTGQNPVYLPWRMAPSGGDFAAMTGEAMLNFASSNMSKADKRALNKAIKEYKSVGSMVKGRRVGAGLQIQGWKGVDDPSAVEVWRNTPDSLRKELMDKVLDVQFRNRGGLSIGEARLAVSDPAQLNAQDGGVQNVGRIFADADRTIDASTHPSYPYAVPGEGVGVLKEDVNVFQLLPDIVSQRGIPDPLNPRATDIRAMQMGAKTGIITADVLRNILGGGVVAAVGAGLMTPQEAEAAGLSALLRMGYPESTAKKILSGELPMDPASRTQRAKEQGYREVFHAGSSDLASADAIDPDAGMFDRAGSGTFMTNNPVLGNTYIPPNMEEGGAMYKLMMRDADYPVVIGNGRNWDEIDGYLDAPGVPELERISGSTNEIARELRGRGFPGVTFQDITDIGPNYKAASSAADMLAGRDRDMRRALLAEMDDAEIYSAFDPSTVRSPLAAFDPDQRNSSNLMAGLGAAGVGAGLLASGEAEAAPQYGASIQPVEPTLRGSLFDTVYNGAIELGLSKSTAQKLGRLVSGESEAGIGASDIVPFAGGALALDDFRADPGVGTAVGAAATAIPFMGPAVRRAAGLLESR